VKFVDGLATVAGSVDPLKRWTPQTKRL